jgi:hypothetical protein
MMRGQPHLARPLWTCIWCLVASKVILGQKETSHGEKQVHHVFIGKTPSNFQARFQYVCGTDNRITPDIMPRTPV